VTNGHLGMEYPGRPLCWTRRWYKRSSIWVLPSVVPGLFSVCAYLQSAYHAGAGVTPWLAYGGPVVEMALVSARSPSWHRPFLHVSPLVCSFTPLADLRQCAHSFWAGNGAGALTTAVIGTGAW